MLFPPESFLAHRQELRTQLFQADQDVASAADRLLEFDPEDVVAHTRLAWLAWESGDRTEAERLCWRSLELDPFGCLPLEILAQINADDPNTSEYLHVLALRAAQVSDSIPREFLETVQSTAEEPEYDYEDPETYGWLAEDREGKVRLESVPEELRRRLRPYDLLFLLARRDLEGFNLELLNQIRAEAGCVGVWRNVVTGWGRDNADSSTEAMSLIVAQLGEMAGPEFLADLWELTSIGNDTLFLHANWAMSRLAKRFPAETIASILAQAPEASTGLRCGMAEQLGLMSGVEGAPAAVMALMADFATRAHEPDAAYLLVASADALARIDRPARFRELLAQYERLLNKEGRRWLKDRLDEPEGFVSRVVAENLPELDIEDVCLSRVLMDDDDEEADSDLDDDEWDDEEDDDSFDEPGPPAVKPGRNDPCWCGSGKKYKKCHLDSDEAAAREEPRHKPVSEDDDARGQALSGLLGTTDLIRRPRDMREAAWEYFGDDPPKHLVEQGSVGFLNWYLFDFRPESTGRTAIEEHLRKHNATISAEAREYLDAWRDSKYGLFEVESAEDGGVQLTDFYTGAGVLVTKTDDAHELKPGNRILARTEERRGVVTFAEDPIPVGPEELEALQQFVQTEIKMTGQTPSEFLRANIHRVHRVVNDGKA